MEINLSKKLYMWRKMDIRDKWKRMKKKINMKS
jgi:hypothetical protein